MFTDPFFDPPEPGHGDDDDDSSDWGFSYGLDVTESLRTVAGLEMPAGSRAWLSSMAKSASTGVPSWGC